jgi:hypothetical protein
VPSLAHHPASSTPIRPTAVELRRLKEVGDGSYDSPSVVVGSPDRPVSGFGYCASGSHASPGSQRTTHFGIIAGTSASSAMRPRSAVAAAEATKADLSLVAQVNMDTSVIVTEDLVFHAPSTAASKNTRKEKSLGSLCQRFLCIYLLGRRSLTLDEAAAVLSGPDAVPPTIMRTKIRRLYDIANVLCTLRLLEKGTSGKRVVFVWRGPHAMGYVAAAPAAVIR